MPEGFILTSIEDSFMGIISTKSDIDYAFRVTHGGHPKEGQKVRFLINSE